MAPQDCPSNRQLDPLQNQPVRLCALAIPDHAGILQRRPQKRHIKPLHNMARGKAVGESLQDINTVAETLEKRLQMSRPLQVWCDGQAELTEFVLIMKRNRIRVQQKRGVGIILTSTFP